MEERKEGLPGSMELRATGYEALGPRGIARWEFADPGVFSFELLVLTQQHSTSG